VENEFSRGVRRRWATERKGELFGGHQVVAELEKKEHTVVGETVGDLGDGDRGEAGVGASVTGDVQDDAE
jgi:hypothetical protein